MTDNHNTTARDRGDVERNRAVEVALVRYVYVGSAGPWLTSPPRLRTREYYSVDPGDDADANTIPPE